jgi:hypothetical protein
MQNILQMYKKSKYKNKRLTVPPTLPLRITNIKSLKGLSKKEAMKSVQRSMVRYKKIKEDGYYFDKESLEATYLYKKYNRKKYNVLNHKYDCIVSNKTKNIIASENFTVKRPYVNLNSFKEMMEESNKRNKSPTLPEQAIISLLQDNEIKFKAPWVINNVIADVLVENSCGKNLVIVINEHPDFEKFNRNYNVIRISPSEIKKDIKKLGKLIKSKIKPSKKELIKKQKAEKNNQIIKKDNHKIRKNKKDFNEFKRKLLGLKRTIKWKKNKNKILAESISLINNASANSNPDMSETLFHKSWTEKKHDASLNRFIKQENVGVIGFVEKRTVDKESTPCVSDESCKKTAKIKVCNGTTLSRNTFGFSYYHNFKKSYSYKELSDRLINKLDSMG